MTEEAAGFSSDGIMPIETGKRTMGFFSTFSIWTGANIVVTTMYTGMLFVPDMTFWQALWLILLGSIAGAVPLVLMGNIGTRTGLPTMVLMRPAFGIKGGILPSAVNILILVGWSWIQAYMAGASLNEAVYFLTGYSNINLFTIVTQASVLVITLYGHKVVESAETIVAAIMVVLTAVLFGFIFMTFHPIEFLQMKTTAVSGIKGISAFDIVVATAFTWVPIVCDYNRHCKNERTGMAGTFFGYILSTVIAMGLGAVVSAFAVLGHQQPDHQMAGIIGQYHPILGFIAAIVIFLSVLSTNVMVLYSAVMSYLSIFSKQRFIFPAIALGIITIGGSLLKEWLLDHFQNFLLMIGTLFIPIFAIVLVDYYIVRKKHYHVDEMLTGEKRFYWYQKGFHVRVYFTYLFGAVFAYYFSYVIPLPIGVTIPTFMATGLFYLAVLKVTERRAAVTEMVKKNLS
ncbi:purine-cytosine permease family protein [Bacillus siamensis]|uniref:purine-cytosine permease family protein n=1 Tax=Bacillus siamensis TaxID=659243 RepID=UPI003F67A207